MKKYLIKRLSLMGLTLFGIAMITFGITRIAPGDPATLKLQSAMTSPKSQPITKRMIEENRKMYGFDKPLFLNFRAKGKAHYIRTLLKKYITEKDPYFANRYYNDLKFLNVLTLSEIFHQMLQVKSPISEERKNALMELVRDSLSLKKDDKKSWAEMRVYYSQLKTAFDYETLKNYIRDFVIKDLSFRKSDLLLAKAAAVPVIMEWILEDENGKKTQELIDILATLTNKPWRYNEDMPEKEKEELFYYINRFWVYEQEKFVEFSFFQKLGRVFSDTQFGLWMGKILRLDFDVSYAHKRPVLDLIAERLPVTLKLNIISLLIIYLLALYIGIYSARIHNTPKEKSLTILLFVLYSLPSFWVANLLIMFFTGGDFLSIFPSQYLHSPGASELSAWEYFLDSLWHLILPIVTLTYGGLAYLSRQMKVSMLEALGQDYIRTARAKGLPANRVVYGHAMRNALIPIVTLLGGLLPSMLGGSIIVEEIFTINGMGKLSFEAIMNRDYPVINAIAFLSAFLTLAGIFISDLLYVMIDPRIQLEKIEM